MSGADFKNYVIGATLLGGIYVVYRMSVTAKEIVTTDLNPAHDENVVNRNLPEAVGNVLDKAAARIKCMFGNDIYCKGIEVTDHVEDNKNVVDVINEPEYLNYFNSLQVEPIVYNDQ
ncbi:MAG: hypothetical protein KJO69_02830 [Gammaproteobacteria bacterium]|nr:hypothetical protein [Gammaproteobacteria bacterium]